jgi:hypothetical protein
MRRFLAAVLISSLPLVAVVPASAAVPARELQYAVVATSGDIVRRATVRVDFVGGSPDHIMNVALDEVDETSERAAGVGIDPKGSLIGADSRQLTSEEEALCSFISLESEDLAGVEPGDHWERQGPTPGGRYHSRFAVLTVSPDGYVDFSVARDVQLDDGSTARWSGTMHYDAEGVVPTTIVLNGTLSGEYAGDGPRSVAISIHLTNDTFKGRAH